MKQINYLSISLFWVFAIISIGCAQKQEQKTTTEPTTEITQPVNTPVQNKLDKNSLVGEWIRTDAPYQIKISGLAEGGSLDAGYFNPKPIHVGKASWSDNADSLTVYIELQDQNYPGSNYTLHYLPGKDELTGKYFQAVEGVTYDVEFVRTK